ncbi:MAG: hypothetical protein DCC55_07110 [Chloroflexi bacterium]|nr:MAG: hypothetical protein DCC55_07110 [Chloroflexota bacterium]
MERVVFDLLLICLVALAAGLIAQRLHLPMLVGYVVAGILIGPYTGGPTVTAFARIEGVAEVGLAFQLFALGVDLSLKTLRPVQRIAWLGTPLQMGLAIGYGMGVMFLFQWPWPALTWFGALLAFSSLTATFQSVEPARLAHTTVGRVILGFLTVQHLLAIPLVLVLSATSPGAGTGENPGWALVKGGVLLALLLFLGLRVLPHVTRLPVIQTPEMYLLTVLVAVALAGVLAAGFGLPFVFAAFAIGLCVSESDFIQRPVRQLLLWRDFFGVLFFVSVGMLLDLSALLAYAGEILAVVVLVLLGKGLLLMLLVRAFGYPPHQAWTVGLVLCQVGELSLFLGYLGRRGGALQETQYSFVVATILLTILVTAIVLKLGNARLLRVLTGDQAPVG